jgi:3-oxoacyl-[acyl-carrier protein] reductase
MGTLATSKRILVTGASRGIGREAALQLAAAGHTVILAARSEAALEAVAREIVGRGGRAETLPLDLTRDESIQEAVERVLRRGGCDVLVNNAGVSEQTDFMLQTVASQREEMELNYWGALRITRALLPAFIARGTGLIVNVSSLLGSVASPTMANYGASKAALESWSHALRAEVSRFGVRVTVFVAPHTQTELGNRSKFDGVRSLPVAYTAQELVRAIDRAPRKYAASPVYRLLLWLARLFPVFMEARVGASAVPYLSPMAPLEASLAVREPGAAKR